MVVRTELTSRWEQDGRERATAVRAWLAGRTAQPDGLGRIDGRIDLRGLRLTGAPLTLGDQENPAGGVVWESVDLSYAHMDSLGLFGARIHDCIFAHASVVDLRMWGTTVTDSSFARADLQNSILGAGEWHGRRAVWKNTTFEGAKLNRSVFTGSSLVRCTFEKPGRLLQLQDCEMTDCTFSGILDSLIIDGRGHRHAVSPTSFAADFSRAVFRNTRITGYQLDHTTLPDQADLVLIHHYPRALQAAATWLEERGATAPEQRAAAFLRQMAAAPGPDDNTDLCFDLDGLRDGELSDAIRRALGSS